MSFSQEQDTIAHYKIDEVTISAFGVESKMKDLPHKVEVLKKREIKSIPSDDLSTLLKKSTSIDIVQYPGFKSNIGMRGFVPTAHGQTYTLVLINGIPAGTQNASTIDLENVEQIEILKGPFSSFFGSGAMAGVINITTPVSRGKIRGNVGVSGGSFHTYKISSGVGGNIIDNLDFNFYFKTRGQNTPYKTGRNNLLNISGKEKNILDEKAYGAVYDDTQYQNINTGLRFGYDINKNWRIQLYGNMSLAYNVYTHGNFWGIYGSQLKDIRRLSFNSTIEGSVKNHIIQIRPYLSGEVVNYYSDISDTNFISSVNNFKTYGFILQDAITFGNHKIIMGVDNNSQVYVSEQYVDKNTRMAPYQPDHSTSSTGIYMQSQLNMYNNKLNVSLGARMDNIFFKTKETEELVTQDDATYYSSISPSLGIQYHLIEGLRVNGGFGTAFLAPDAFKKTGSYSRTSAWGTTNYKGNPDLDPEKSISKELGMSYNNRTAGISASFTFFNNKLDGLIVYDRSNPDTTSFMNANSSVMEGLELFASYNIGALSGYKYSLKLYANITHMLKTEVTIDEQTEDMKYVRDNKSSFGIEYRNNSGLSIKINARYSGNRLEDNWLYTYDYTTYEKIPYTTIDSEEIRPDFIDESVLEHPEFLVVDLSATYSLKKQFLFGLEVENVFDELYTEKDSYYSPGRKIMGSLTYNF